MLLELNRDGVRLVLESLDIGLQRHEALLDGSPRITM